MSKLWVCLATIRGESADEHLSITLAISKSFWVIERIRQGSETLEEVNGGRRVVQWSISATRPKDEDKSGIPLNADYSPVTLVVQSAQRLHS